MKWEDFVNFRIFTQIYKSKRTKSAIKFIPPNGHEASTAHLGPSGGGMRGKENNSSTICPGVSWWEEHVTGITWERRNSWRLHIEGFDKWHIGYYSTAIYNLLLPWSSNWLIRAKQSLIGDQKPTYGSGRFKKPPKTSHFRSVLRQGKPKKFMVKNI